MQEASDVSLGDEGEKGFLTIDVRTVVATLGFAACFAWLFLMIAAPGSAFLLESSFGNGLAAHLAFLGGVVAALLATWGLSDFFSARKPLQLFLAIVFALCGFAGLAVLDSEGLQHVFTVLLGAGFGLLYPLYGELFSFLLGERVQQRVDVVFALASAICAGGGVLFAISGISFSFNIAVVLPLISFVAYGMVYALVGFSNFPQTVGRRESDARTKIVWRSYLSTVTSGLASGYALGCMLALSQECPWVYGLAGISAAVVCIALFVDETHAKRINETFTMRFFLPFAAVIVFPMLFVPASGKVVLAVALLCGSLLPTTCSLSAVCRHISICSLSAVRVFSFGRLMGFLGIAAGLLLSFLGFGGQSFDAVASLSQSVSVVAFMLLVILSASFVMTEDNYPANPQILLGNGVDAGGKTGTPIRKIEANPPRIRADDAQGAGDKGHRLGIFRIKCAIVSKHYGLSKRQSEVLVMLAKGRNAEYVTEKLVISPHTAKAHIYNIYQKTGVHSRQELMDLVEDTDVSTAADEGIDVEVLASEEFEDEI